MTRAEKIEALAMEIEAVWHTGNPPARPSISSRAAATIAQDRIDAAGRLLDWCLPRLPMAYRPTLQRMRADPMEFDHTPIVQSETRHD